MTAKKSNGNQINRRGGKRTGAGRPSGRRNKATIEQKLTLEELARTHTDTALAVLVDIAQHGQSEAARVSAANSILDRGYGKPRQLEPEPALEAAKAERDAEVAAKQHAELMRDLDEMLSEFLVNEEQPPQPNRRLVEPNPLLDWTTGWNR